MSPTASPSLVGRRVDGRYQVLHHLADGGMGSVYVALDERLDRHVALKIMRPDLARDEAFVERFRREARSAARLSHPNIVAVTDQGQDEQYVFIAMELVEGTTLRELLRVSAPLPARRTLDIASGILAAIAVAHRAGIVHRDIKPENVLLRDDGTVKVVDFGLARAVTTHTFSTDASVMFGTAAYLAPEQVETGTASERSDVYTVGLLVYEMLTGAKAFPGDSPIHVAYQHVHGTVPRASGVVPTVPPVLDEFIAHATATDPEERPADAAEMLDHLQAVQRSLRPDQLDALPPASAGGPDGQVAHTSRLGTDSTHQLGRYDGAPVRARRRRPVLLAVIGVLVLALVAAGGWLFTAGPLGEEKMPDVVGRQQGAALSALHARHLDSAVREVYSETVPKGSVVASRPGPGAQVRRIDSVTLQVSRGPERHTVPTLAGNTRAQAQAALTGARLTLGAVTDAYSETVAAGRVISSAPAAGASLKRDTRVGLVLSKGRQPITIPNVVGTSDSAATSTLNGLGFTAQEGTQQFSDTVAQGDVISQTPSSGTGYRGDGVTLVISKGPELVTIPDVTGQTSQKAKATLEALGLKVQIDRFFGGLFNDVRATDPSPGAQVRKGSTVTLSVV
ncbi:Stk1 family PASTA domain-containing Ser/Thr kinase [Allobranchiibius sp. CTAmp26]|uniref:Stk1 family PASTA domain-containing Ser/Thr kinase n=1 Tax=Allobranchiibius sp. CTAmp26 TaxID=2815214 RepID=UPI0027DB2E21|nr:Stk1 family PASTA domain-containing Ser/Thr kinase [Allobranchiibius sp. CTAmp26]